MVTRSRLGLAVDYVTPSLEFLGQSIDLEGTGNGGNGLTIEDARDVRIGAAVDDPNPAFGNFFAGNGGAGLRVDGALGAIAIGNRFAGNGGMAIDVGPEGVTPNDDPDVDGVTNTPSLDVAYRGSRVEGSYTGPSFTEALIEFAASDPCTDWFGGVEWEIAREAVTTDESGEATFSIDVDRDVPPGSAVIGTATVEGTGTSELSSCRSVADFSVSVSPSSITLDGQGQGTFTITVTGEDGDFGGDVSLTCPDAPSGVSCSFEPSSVSPGDGDVESTLTVTGSSPQLALGLHGWGLGLTWAGLFALVLLPSARRKGRVRQVVLGLALVASGLAVACGTEEPTGPADGPLERTFTVRGTSGSAQHDATVTVTIP